MDPRGPDAAVKQNLLDRLLHAVKQVQVHFGARQEIATESDMRVSTLCNEWEAVLLHGQRKPKPKRMSPTSRGAGSSLGNLWQVAKLALSPEETQRFLQLVHTTSEVGRGRAWLRASINERTLENYLHTILGSFHMLRELYIESAFVLDQERSSMLPVMAAGLSSIIFSIPIDADYLNTPSRSVDIPPEATPPPVIISHTPNFIDRIPENNGEGDIDDDVIAINAKEKKKRKKKPRSHDSSMEQLQEVGVAQELGMAQEVNVVHEVGVDKPILEPPPTWIETVTRNISPGPVGSVGGVRSEVDTPPIGESTSSSSSKLSINDEGNSPMFVALGRGGMPHDLITSEAEAAVSATALVLSATTGQPVESVGSVESGVGGHSQMSIEELREAVLVLVKGKKDLEESNDALREQVAELETSRQQLLSDLEASTAELHTEREAHSSQLTALERENDLLREQLKKYVGMVQTKRRESSAEGTESLVPSVSEPSDGGQEQKLIEMGASWRGLDGDYSAKMAEMYAELMELNERLHKAVASKDTMIVTLVGSLRQAGLEIPVPVNSLPSEALKPKALVDVWIPSAIKKGRGPDTHHVYQVFVRVRSEEWNVYRRYAEFREFHLQLVKHVPQANSFSFPPRKTRNKTAQVVEERRLKLQDYLRQVIQLCSSPVAIKGRSKAEESRDVPIKPILQADITKSTLVNLFPFFREDLYVDTQQSKPTSDPLYRGL